MNWKRLLFAWVILPLSTAIAQNVDPAKNVDPDVLRFAEDIAKSVSKEWTFFDADDVRPYTARFIHRDTSVQGTTRSSWVLTVYSEEMPGISITDDKPYRSTKFLFVADCKAKTLGGKQGIFYGDGFAQGPALGSHSVSKLKLDDVAPETRGAVILKAICSRKVSK
jgi:hypothetical protein